MKNLKIMFAATLLQAPLAFSATTAEQHTCTHQNMTRTVGIEYEGEVGKAPCRVMYDKSSEGVGPQAVWSADNMDGYCEEKSEELINKLSGWGWDCKAEGSGQTAAGSAQSAEGSSQSTQSSTETPKANDSGSSMNQ